jgi:hypothetical protein
MNLGLGLGIFEIWSLDLGSLIFFHGLGLPLFLPSFPAVQPLLCPSFFVLHSSPNVGIALWFQMADPRPRIGELILTRCHSLHSHKI